jgi:ATP synthase F1 gamma subunit
MPAEELNEQIEITDMVRALAQAYEEVAVMQMQKVRDSVLGSRIFFDEIAKVYVEVKMSYIAEILKLRQKKKKILKGKEDSKSLYSFSTLTKNGKEVAVLLMPNERLAGNVGYLVFNDFLDYIKKNQETEIIIIGSLGRAFFDNVNTDKRSYQFFEMPKETSPKELKSIIDVIIKYQEVSVFHGKFINLVKQEPIRSNITGEFKFNGDEKSLQQRHYLFEPTLEKILNFFEVQIFVYLLMQTFSESNLAKLGSRINAMEISTKNAEELKKKLLMEKRVIDKGLANRKQLQRIAGISVWGKEKG